METMCDGQVLHDCHRIGEVLSRVGDKWSTLVIYRLRDGRVRFNALKRDLGISQRMLSLTLRDLEREGLVRRHAYPTIPPKVEYELTELGHGMLGPISALAQWAERNLSSIDAARAAFDGGDGREAAAG
jgi:DNA-binding HxlR family transcriptional regulator